MSAVTVHATYGAALHAQAEEKVVVLLRERDARAERRAIDEKASGLDADAVERLVAKRLVRRHQGKLWLDEAAVAQMEESQAQAGKNLLIALLIMLSVGASAFALLRLT